MHEHPIVKKGWHVEEGERVGTICQAEYGTIGIRWDWEPEDSWTYMSFSEFDVAVECGNLRVWDSKEAPDAAS